MTTVQGIPPKFDHKKILKVIKKEFGKFATARSNHGRHRSNLPPACNGTIISDTESKGMGEVIQLQGDQRNKIKDFLCDKDGGLGLDEKTIKVRTVYFDTSGRYIDANLIASGPRLLSPTCRVAPLPSLNEETVTGGRTVRRSTPVWCRLPFNWPSTPVTITGGAAR